jgi:4-hydroxybenzoyl-CoA reductase subunit beta
MLPLPSFQCLEPATLEEAAMIMKEAGERGRILGGGTDLVPSMRQGIFAPELVVSLQSIPVLRELTWRDDEGLRIGAYCTLREIESSHEVQARYPLAAQAAREVASPTIRHMATVGGNICLDTRCYFYNQSEDWRSCGESCLKAGGEFCKASPNGKARKCFAVFSADLATALIALGADIELVSVRGLRRLPLADFYTGDGAKPNAKEPDEILSCVILPPASQILLGVYLKYRIRQTIDYPLAGVALTLGYSGKTRTVEKAALVISGVANKPVAVKGIEDALRGRPLEEAGIEQAALLARKAAMPLANTAGQRGHRKQMIYEFTKQAFASLKERTA